MKLITAASLLALAAAQCTDQLELNVEEGMKKLSFQGYRPNVNRKLNTGNGNKVVLRGYDRQPIVEESGEYLSIRAGEPCDGVAIGEDTNGEGGQSPSGSDGGTSTNGGGTSASSAAKMAGWGLPLFLGGRSGSVGVVGSSLLAMAFSTTMMSPMVSGQDTTISECDIVPIEVDIFVDATADAIVMQEFQSGDYEVCPPETLWWKHHPDIFNGYEGCVSESSYWPCATDSQGVLEEDGTLASKYPVVWDGEQCVETGYTRENRTFWILWGDPSDKYELNLRTGFNPVVSFPFNRGPYPNYDQGGDLSDKPFDDSADARAMAKDLQLYLGAFTEEELAEFDVVMTEGAESGMTHMWAAKALEIARTTCNRDIYALMEVPAYGYSNSDAAALANSFADSFYNSSECLCFADDSCKDPTVTISSVGWLPLTPLPVRLGGDNQTYVADSTAASSPWFESMVFPENPSGKIKTPQLQPNRRVCDGVYLWPMYFGMRDFRIPLDERPDCSLWSFSITKAYSASVRAGFIMFKQEPVTNHEALVDVIDVEYSMTHGLYSEWSWHGQMQLWEMIMSRPLDDPTSWIGAYSDIMEEKWSTLIDGFQDCPVTQVSNPYAGAYAWFVYQPEYTGIQGGFVSSFFRDVLGIRTTTYNWGFRGADPADYYGEGYGIEDFTRLQLYRDVSVYEEVARRAKIVCANPDATVGDFISVNQWVAGEGTTQRRLNEGYKDREERKRHLQEVIPGLNERQLEYLAASHEESDKIDAGARACAPHYTTDCLMKKVGNRFKDF